MSIAHFVYILSSAPFLEIKDIMCFELDLVLAVLSKSERERL